MHTPRNGKTSDPFFAGGLTVDLAGGFFFYYFTPWIRSQWSVHRFSFPTVVSLWTFFFFGLNCVSQSFAAHRFPSHPYFRDCTNFLFCF